MDDEQDKSVVRSQLIGLVLMMVMLLMWFQYMGRKQPPQPAPETPPAAGTESVDTDTSGREDEAANGTASADEWPYLPPVADVADPAEDEFVLENEHLRLLFTRVGARLKQVYVKLSLHGEEEIALIPEQTVEGEDSEPVSDLDAVYPLGLRFTDEKLGDKLDRRRFDAVVDEAAGSVTFSLGLPVATIRKTITLGDTPYSLDVQVEYENTEKEPRPLGIDMTPAYSLKWGPNIAVTGSGRSRYFDAIVWWSGEQLSTQATRKMKRGSDGAPFLRTVHDVDWMGLKSAYFVVAYRPDFAAQEGWMEGDKDAFSLGVAVPAFELAPGDIHRTTWQLYLGPNQRECLAAAWPTLTEARRYFESVRTMDRFAKLLLLLLNWFYSIFGNYGVAIILLTVLVRMVMYPLTLKQTRSMKRMQLLAPELEALKQKYGDDQQELSKRMMEMYRERGVNPMGGCFPLLLQMPIFIGLYRMLMSAFEIRGAPFVLIHWGDYEWIRSLSEPDRLLPLPWLAGVPFLGSFEYLNILPILGALAMILTTKLTPASGAVQNPSQKTMMMIMPLFFAFICYNFASGLNLYILTSTTLQLVQQKLIPVGEVTLPEKRAPKKKQHFYTAAQARKRRIEKEGKDRKQPSRSKGAGKKSKDQSHR